jgi:hypothetical protein
MIACRNLSFFARVQEVEISYSGGGGGGGGGGVGGGGGGGTYQKNIVVHVELRIHNHIEGKITQI